MNMDNLPRNTLINTALVLSLCFFASTSTQAGTTDDKGGIESFIRSIAAATYSTAWPSATFKSTSFKGTTKVTGGYDVLVRLTGESAFGGELWLDLVFEIRSGGLHDIRVSRHNAILIPPFETAKALGALVEQIIEDYNKSARPTTTAERAGAVCVMNPTKHTLNFSYRWGTEGEWKKATLESKRNSWYWWRYAKGSRSSPKFYVRFDDSFASGYTEKTYWLERYSTTLPITCDRARQYRFTTSGREIGIEPLR